MLTPLLGAPSADIIRDIRTGTAEQGIKQQRSPHIAYNFRDGFAADRRHTHIILNGADAASIMGFTQVPNFLLKSKKLTPATRWHSPCCFHMLGRTTTAFPDDAVLPEDLRIEERSVRRNLKALEENGLLTIQRRGLGKTNIYEVYFTVTSDVRFRPHKNVRSRKVR
ncbi:hypothetical protein [Bradyrhizobium sp. CSS354]|uniref:hypothetical protein n=1 Tax=Bradyrhizobium sp. CSS354 TaxID=2699172 RepID=UPI0023B1BB5B|nr:hypothetical protein [Bradyrhizobium sp. CSS354]MDE5465394.1 hypothetical protein [Bradyrhizobium sp. CSS354]